MIIHFANNDIEYEDWCKNNRNGYVFNCFGGAENRSDMNIVHKADCSYLWRKADEGKRTTRYDKYCSTDIVTLTNHVQKERGSRGVVRSVSSLLYNLHKLLLII